MKNSSYFQLAALFTFLSSSCLAAKNVINLGHWNAVSLSVSEDGATVVGGINNRPARWKAAGFDTVSNLGRAIDTNFDGSVSVGHFMNDGLHAFRWTSSGMVDLGTLGGDISLASGISEDGAVIVGYASIVDNERGFAVRWDGTSIQSLGGFGGIESLATDVNYSGSVIVGWANNADEVERAFRWSSGIMVDIGTLGGLSAHATATDSSGSVVVGNAANASNAWHAFRWTEGSGMVELSHGDTYSTAQTISSDGKLIGGHGLYEAVFWDESLQIRQLDDLLLSQGFDVVGWHFSTIESIGFDGSFYHFAGFGSYNNDERAFLVSVDASTVPESSTWALLGIGALVLGYSAFRRWNAV